MGSSSHRRLKRAFTLVEMLVTIVIIAVAVVAVFQGIAVITETEARAREAELLQRLACQKMSEMGTVSDPRTTENSGNFADQGYEAITWTVDVEPSDTVNIDQITVTAERGEASQKIVGLVFERPETSAGDPGAASAGNAGNGNTGRP